MTREELNTCVLSVAEGKPEALGSLYDALYQPVFLLAASLSGSRLLAEDVVQEVFLVVRACAPRYRAGADPKAWVYGITRNVTRELLRKAHHEIPAEEPVQTDAPPAQIGFEKSCLDGIVVLEALDALTAEEYRITVLHVFGDFKLTEIARYLQIPYGTVLWRYNEAKKKLRRFYAVQDDGTKEADGHEE